MRIIHSLDEMTEMARDGWLAVLLALSLLLVACTPDTLLWCRPHDENAKLPLSVFLPTKRMPAPHKKGLD